MVKHSWVVIVNPKAGGGKVENDWPIILEELNKKGIKFTAKFTNHKYHAVELTISSIKEGYRNFISVGGDGTIHELVNGIFLQKEVPYSEFKLGVIPAGSGNDWIRMYGIPSDYSEAISAIVKGKTIRQDIVKVDVLDAKVSHTRYMVNIAGVGFDAKACYYCNRAKDGGGRGKMIYVKAALRALWFHKAKQCRIIVDGELFFEGKAFSIAFGTGKYSGGGMQQTPTAVPHDGLTNITVIKNMSKLLVLREFRKLFLGTIYTSNKIVHAMGKEITVEYDSSEKVEVDGEVVGDTELSLVTIPNALEVVVGPSFD